MTPTDTVPVTEAGRAWLDAIQPRGSLLEWQETRNGILAIEAEVARIAAVIGAHNMLHDGRCDCGDHDDWPIKVWFNDHVAAALYDAGLRAEPAEVAGLDDVLRQARQHFHEGWTLESIVRAALAATEPLAPEPLDVERLARAMDAHYARPNMIGYFTDEATAIASEYARLSEGREPEPGS